MEEMIKTFLEQIPGSIDQMEKEIFAGNWQKASEIAHKMKPSFTFMGMEETKMIVKEFEVHCEADTDKSRLLDLMDQIKANSEKAVAELEKLNIKI